MMPLSRKPGFLMPLLVALCAMATQAAACQPRDYMALIVPQNSPSPAVDALRLAYEDVTVSDDGASVSLDGKVWFALGTIRDIPPAARLRDPGILEQFTYRYPLRFDLTQRRVPYVDPGRLRNGAFFAALYFDSEQAARASLIRVSEPALAPATFQVTRKRNVSCQLAAALATLAASGEDYGALLKGAGGGFNWRQIAGTTRLSTHSFGIAVDVNAQLGKYWRWTGASPGTVGDYDNAIPESFVATMERFGFIWGGKWHHFDGMHFEYRPELILHSRMTRNGAPD